MAKKVFVGSYDKQSIIADIPHRNTFIVGDPIDGVDGECISYTDSIMYKYYFKWLAEIHEDSLLILNNVLKSTVRTCLEYNCIRHYCAQAGNVLVFNDLPILNSKQDFLILYDFIQPDPFWKEDEIGKLHDVDMNFCFELLVDDIKTTDKDKATYEAIKTKAATEVKKDPNIIPRRLLKFAEGLKSKGYDKLTDFKPRMRICVSDLKVDQYFYRELLRKMREAKELYDCL